MELVVAWLGILGMRDNGEIFSLCRVNLNSKAQREIGGSDRRKKREKIGAGLENRRERERAKVED